MSTGSFELSQTSNLGHLFKLLDVGRSPDQSRQVLRNLALITHLGTFKDFNIIASSMLDRSCGPLPPPSLPKPRL